MKSPQWQSTVELLVRGDARQACERAETLAREHDDAASQHLLALSAACSGDFAEAIPRLRRAVEADPGRTRWRRDLAILYAGAARWEEAARTCCEVLAAHRADAEILALYGRSLFSLGKNTEAAAALEESLTIDSECASRHALLAGIYSQLQRHALERRQREEVVRLRPADAEAIGWLALSTWKTGDLQACQQLLRSLIRRGHASLYLDSFFLCALLHDPDQNAATLRQEHEAWAARHCPQPAPDRTFANVPDPDRRLRIGYVTGDFVAGPSFHFLGPLLRSHDRAQVEMFCYHGPPTSDHRTGEYRQVADTWRDSRGLSEAALADLIRKDSIDILVDYSGHFWYHQLRVFHLRAAPLQVNLPNYPGTTGLAALDFLLTDSWVCPPGAESEYTEPVLRLPNGYFVYQPPPEAPAITPLPAERNGGITFGLFQRPTKLNPAVWDAVAATLRQTPRSQLLIHYADSDLDLADSRARQRLIHQLQSRGVGAGRVRFRGPLRLADHLAVLAEVDIGLDAFPYNGHTTSCECLWMGVPFVTLAGHTHAGRVGSAILSRAGIAHLVARSLPEYVEKAVRLASDRASLAALRADLRGQVNHSSLTDAVTFARSVEAAYRLMWRGWCSAHPAPVPTLLECEDL